VTPLGRPRVLIVEDDPDLLVVLRVNLEGAGLETMLASDGHTAISRIEGERPDAVLLDVMLPGIDGWSVLEHLHGHGDPVPVVVCSAKKNAEDMARAHDLGAVSYLVKPFDIDRLVDSVTDAVARRSRFSIIELERRPDLGVEPA
jgi:DNA-binding response OmpR family regulator